MSNSVDRQTFLFTFRPNEEANGKPLVEILAEQLADYDPSVAGNALRLAWYGTVEAMVPMMVSLGFSDFDAQGTAGALGDHRNADRRLDLTPDELKSAGFIEAA